MATAPILTPQSEDFPRWYQDLIQKAELAENGPVRGTMVIRPYGYAIWERMQAEMDARIKEAGARNAYFPLFIPEEFLRREAEHVEGFSPELAVVTHAGGKELEEPVVVRPTSETIINHYFAKWIQSHRDLPMLINQWANVVRWELRPRIFLRTTEFLWQEGHTCHRTEAEAHEYATRILHDTYEDFMVRVLAMPVTVGRKTAAERFAGATNTMTCEAQMRDLKALQMGTSHELGQNFSVAFGTSFQDTDGVERQPWQTSWGTSTRMMGGVIMTHGDDRGLRLPPNLAPVQVVVMAIRDDAAVIEEVGRIHGELLSAGVRVDTDLRTDVSFGRRAVDWELKGVPIRLELGPRDLSSGEVTLARRDTGDKSPVSLTGLASTVVSLLAEIQEGLYAEARERRESTTSDVATVAEAVEAAATGWARIPWADLGVEGESALAEKGITVRCLVGADGGVPESDDEEGAVAVVARAY